MGEVEKVLEGEYDGDMLTSASCITVVSLLCNNFILPRNIFAYVERGILSRKPANTPNGILVTLTNAITSYAYDNIAFSIGLAKMEIAGVEWLTAQ